MSDRMAPPETAKKPGRVRRIIRRVLFWMILMTVTASVIRHLPVMGRNIPMMEVIPHVDDCTRFWLPKLYLMSEAPEEMQERMREEWADVTLTFSRLLPDRSTYFTHWFYGEKAWYSYTFLEGTNELLIKRPGRYAAVYRMGKDGQPYSPETLYDDLCDAVWLERQE